MLSPRAQLQEASPGNPAGPVKPVEEGRLTAEIHPSSCSSRSSFPVSSPALELRTCCGTHLLSAPSSRRPHSRLHSRSHIRSHHRPHSRPHSRSYSRSHSRSHCRSHSRSHCRSRSTFLPTHPVFSAPPFQQAFFGNVATKPDREASRPVKQVGEL